MTEHQTSRTIVKSAPELWAECSDAASLARHLGAFGEIRITKLEPETTVAWEGAAVCGTVRLEPSGWGTRVTLTVTEDEAAPEWVDDEPAPVRVEDDPVTNAGVEDDRVTNAGVEDDPVADDGSAGEPAASAATAPAVPEPRRSLLARLRDRLRPRPVQAPVASPPGPPGPVAPAAPEAEVEAEPQGEADPAAPAPPTEAAARQGEEALAAALDSLGRAHHRPFSRV